ncbi:P-loop containing nucleoside triphosphate hydrolase protein [Crassisporium funariophilum]|nr:P-loop containing nucleoside triphosphate hydrolase protein [Crassisporium funariophilum]
MTTFLLKTRLCSRCLYIRKEMAAYSTKGNPFADSSSAEFMAAAKSIESIPTSTGLPEIIVTGRANAGKSTLLNAVLGRRSLLSTSSKAGHTRSLNFYRVGAEPGKLLVVDAPGYGARGRAEWGKLFDHYIATREQLKRIYIFFNAKHGLNAFDKEMLEHLSAKLLTARGTQPFTLQAVVTKVDLLPNGQIGSVLKTISKDIFKAAPLCLPPIITSSEMSPPFGIDALRESMAEACGQ